MARATLSGVVGPDLTEIHRSSSVLPELFFFFFIFDLDVSEACLSQQLQPWRWRQQQQWQHTTRVVRKTSRGRVRTTTRQMVLNNPWLCLFKAKLQIWLKNSWMLSVVPSMVFCHTEPPLLLTKRVLAAAEGLLNPYFYLLNPSHDCEVISGQYN